MTIIDANHKGVAFFDTQARWLEFFVHDDAAIKCCVKLIIYK